jgi:FkbM family methyltransferase
MTEMVRALLNGEYQIVLPKHRAERPEWYTPEGWERHRLGALHWAVKSQPDPVVYYVGAEEGEMAALCQMWGAQMVLFEPNPRVWPNIRAIWEANELTPPWCFVGFASNATDLNPPNGEPRREGTGIWPDCACGPVIGDHGFKELYQEADAFPQIRIDDLPADVPPPTVITFDVEGSEWQVLRGAEQTIREHKPILVASIHPEFMFHQWGEYSRDFRNWIIDLGYDESFLDWQHELHTLYLPREQ